MAIRRILRLWGLSLAASLLAILASIRWLDIPVAMHFLGNINRFGLLEEGLSRPVLVTGEMALLLALAVMRLLRGALPEQGKALFLAACTSLSAFAANDYGLKKIFGRRIPMEYFRGAYLHGGHIFHFLHGSHHSSFPSGHMVLATAFAATLARIYPRLLPLLLALLGLGAVALVVGDWHFVADVIAGLFVGATLGLAAAEVWLRCRIKPGLENSTGASASLVKIQERV